MLVPTILALGDGVLESSKKLEVSETRCGLHHAFIAGHRMHVNKLVTNTTRHS